MILFAISDVIWEALIAAVLAVYLEWSRRKVATKVAEVAEKVEIVRHATNSLTDRLVKTTEAEAFTRGGIEERARSDARKGDAS